MLRTNRTITTLALLLTLSAAAVSVAREAAPIPAHPSRIDYPELDYRLPQPSQFREVLPNGMVVYIAEDKMLPKIDLRVVIRAAAAFEPADKAGLAALVGDQLRDGGTAKYTPEQFDEKIEFLAASIGSSIGETQGSASLGVLSKDIDEGLDLLVEMLRYPRFEEERLRRAKDRILQNIKRRNDSTNGLAGIEWGFLMYGEDHFTNRYPSTATINNITREDMRAFHRRYVHPGNMMIAVAGDFDRADMLARLEEAFGGWPVGETAPQTFADPGYTPRPGVYVIHKEDVNQGNITIGHRSILRGSPDEFALRIMNGVLGGGGFKSRLMERVRSQEGLAYSVGSRYGFGVYYPTAFQAFFQSKSNSCAYGTRIVLDEIERMRTELVDDAALSDAKNYYVESFPKWFDTKMALLGVYLDDEYTGRDPRYWLSFVDRTKAVTAEDVRRVAAEHLHPDKLVILAVGDADAIISGGHDKAPGLGLAAFGQVTRLPLRDPDTLKR